MTKGGSVLRFLKKINGTPGFFNLMLHKKNMVQLTPNICTTLVTKKQVQPCQAFSWYWEELRAPEQKVIKIWGFHCHVRSLQLWIIIHLEEFQTIASHNNRSHFHNFVKLQLKLSKMFGKIKPRLFYRKFLKWFLIHC